MLKDLIIEFKSNSYGELISMTDFVLALCKFYTKNKKEILI
jgi:hypothetical protein